MLSLRGNEAKSHTGEVKANYQKYKISKMLLLHQVCMYVCITHNHKVIVEALISERIVNDVSESNSIVCCMRERMQGKTRPT